MDEHRKCLICLELTRLQWDGKHSQLPSCGCYRFLYFTWFQPSICKFSLFLNIIHSLRTFKTAAPILQKSFDRDLLGLLAVDRDVSSTFDAMMGRWVFFVGHVENEKQTSTLQKLRESRKTRNFIFKSALAGEYVGSLAGASFYQKKKVHGTVRCDSSPVTYWNPGRI